MVPISYYVTLSAILFGLGVIGVLFKRNIITIFMSIELMLNAVNLAFVAFGRSLGQLQGQVFVFFVIVVAAAVIVASLLIQGTSLPWLLRRLGLRAEDFGTEENKARLKAARAALEWLDDQTHVDAADEATKSARSLYEAKVRRLYLSPPSDEESDDAQELERYRTLRLKLLGVERSVVLGLRRDGRINATLLRTIERDLDLEEARLSGS